MAPRAKPMPRGGADDSEDDLAATAFHSTPAGLSRATTKMPRAKSKMTRRASVGKATTKRKAASRQPRQALKDRTNLQDGNETEEVDAFEDDDTAETAKPKAKRAKTAAATRKTSATRSVQEPREEVPEKPKIVRKKGRPPKRAPSPEQLLTIPETQPDPDMMEDVEQSIEVDPNSVNVVKELHSEKVVRAPSVPVQSLQPLQPRPSTRSGSAQPTYARPRERSGSANAVDRRGTDPELRRQLNELTKKYDELSMKYESVQAVGQDEAQSNFEKLKKATDQRARDASELIASLKKELLELKKSSSTVKSESTSLQKQFSSLNGSNEMLTKERDELKDKFQVSQNEVKSLEAKLAAARQQLSNNAQEVKAQEIKKLNSSVSISSGDAHKEARMKENLYADLTGLIVRGVKRKDGEDEYDCIQTGRNGTLHFHLSIANDAATPHPKTPSGLSYEDAEFAYEPLLDESRDKELLDLLPDYLTEEICFPRNHAQRFYSKVVDSMTKRIVIDED